MSGKMKWNENGNEMKKWLHISERGKNPKSHLTTLTARLKTTLLIFVKNVATMKGLAYLEEIMDCSVVLNKVDSALDDLHLWTELSHEENGLLVL